jgi:hypothetical protein
MLSPKVIFLGFVDSMLIWKGQETTGISYTVKSSFLKSLQGGLSCLWLSLKLRKISESLWAHFITGSVTTWGFPAN